MRFKAGVYLRGVSPELVLGLLVLDRIYEEHGYRMTVTSLVDGLHSDKSLHYSGRAADVRTNDINDDMIDAIFFQAQRELPEDFDIVLEARGTDNEHIHIEYDVRGRLPAK